MKDIYTERPLNPDTMASLGPIAPLAGSWHGEDGIDTHPQKTGPESEPYVEDWDFEVIDPQSNGPQQLFGMRYHLHITKPGELTAFHDQCGYILYEPDTGKVFMTLSIPRAQAAMAVGTAKPGDRSVTLHAERGSMENGIVSNPFLEENFRTTAFDITFKFNEDGTITYEETTFLEIPGVEGVFKHTDVNTMHMVGAARPNAAMIDEGLLNRNPRG